MDIEKIISEAGYNDNFNALMAEAEAFTNDKRVSSKNDKDIVRALTAIARAAVAENGTTCENCNGTGRIIYNPNLNPDVNPGMETAQCTRCGGTGMDARAAVAENERIATIAGEMKAAVGQRLRDKGPMYEMDDEWRTLSKAVKANEDVGRYYKTEGEI